MTRLVVEKNDIWASGFHFRCIIDEFCRTVILALTIAQRQPSAVAAAVRRARRRQLYCVRPLIELMNELERESQGDFTSLQFLAHIHWIQIGPLLFPFLGDIVMFPLRQLYEN